MKKNYFDPAIEILAICAEDVLTASAGRGLTFLEEVNHEDLDSITIVR